MSRLDIARNVFRPHGVDAAGQVLLHRKLRRAQSLASFAERSPALMAIEACGTAHHWARGITALGHEVRLMPPACAKPWAAAWTGTGEGRRAPGHPLPGRRRDALSYQLRLISSG